MNTFSSRHGSSNPVFSLAAVLLAGLVGMLCLAGPAAADSYSPQQRKAYFDSGKYSQDLNYVAKRARRWIIKRSKPTLNVVMSCRKAGYRVGRKDPGPDPNADYTVPVRVPRRHMPRRPVVAAPNPGPGPTAGSSSGSRSAKRFKRVKVSKRKCARTKRLAIAMDMDETAMSSFRYGSPQPNYDNFAMIRNEIHGSQTALKPMLRTYRLAIRRGMAAFVITARYEPLTADPLVGLILGNADLCDPALNWASACGIDINSFNFTRITRANLRNAGYRKLTGLYMRPPDSPSKGGVKNAERAEIVKRRGYRLIAMFGDQSSDLDQGFYERGFKYQSPEGP